MFKRLTTILCLFLVGCATVDRVPTDYTGPDAGRVVLGIGAAAGTSYSSYSLFFRKRDVPGGAEKAAQGRFAYFQTNIFFKQVADYQSPAESGVVLVHSLPPGEYEIFNFDVFLNGGTIQNNFGSRTDFSIPFKVRPGLTTYLGNYQANKLTGKNLLGLSIPAGAVFLVTDRLESEMSIAQTKATSALGAGQNATPQPAQIRNPFFVSPQQPGGLK